MEERTIQLRVLLLFCALAAFTSCTSVSSTSGPPGSATLRIAQLQEPSALNPLLLNGTVGIETASLIYSYLLKFDDRGRLIADAAREVPTLANGGISSDGKHLIYHLRRGIRFSDGVELTAEDVIFTVAAVMNPKNLIQSRLGYDQISSIHARDRYTIEIALKQPYAPILALLCAPGNVYPIMPKHVLEKFADVNQIDFNGRPIGSGPYTVAEWRRGDRIVLEANKTYWQGTPKISRIEIRFTADYNAMANRLSSGDVDAVFNADSSTAPQLKQIPGVNVTFTPIYAQGALIFNTQDPITSDPRVRRALSMAIDTAPMVSKASHGIFSSRDAGRGLFEWAYNRAILQMPPYDPAGARALLEQAGWKLGADGVRHKNGRALDVLFILEKGSQAFSIIGNTVQQYERAIGVNLMQKEYVVEQFVLPAQKDGPVYGGKFQIAEYPFLPGLDPDVSDQFECNRIPPAGFNKPRFCEKAMDAALARGISTFDLKARQSAYNDVQRILAAKLPMLLLYQGVQTNAFPKWLTHQTTAVTTPFWNVAAWSR